MLEFGNLNMLTLQIGPFWVYEGFEKNFKISDFPTFPDISRQFPDISRHFPPLPDISRADVQHNWTSILEGEKGIFGGGERIIYNLKVVSMVAKV